MSDELFGEFPWDRVHDNPEEVRAASKKAEEEFEKLELDENGRPVDALDREARQKRIEEAGGEEAYRLQLFPNAMTDEEIEEWRSEASGERIPPEQSELGEGNGVLEMDAHIYARLNGDISREEFHRLNEETDPRTVDQVTLTPDDGE